MKEIPQCEHPAGARLDGVATGDSDADATAHVASCAACSAYVTALRAGIDAFSRQHSERPDGFVDAVIQRRAMETSREPPESRRPLPAGARSIGRWVAGATSVLALAAMALLVLRPRSTEPLGGGGLVPSEGPIRFKGGAQVAVIVDHRGVQTRELGTLRIAPGDRIRVEIALDHDSQVTAGVLTESGGWAELQAPSTFETGTHFSEKSIAFDGDIEPGWVIVGPPPVVERARRTRDFGIVHAIRIHPVAP